MFAVCSQIGQDSCRATQPRPHQREIAGKHARHKERKKTMAKKASRRGRPPGKAGRRGGRGLKVISTVDLRAELGRREGQVGKLQTRHRVLSAELAQLEGELAAFGLTSGAGGRAGRRPRVMIPAGRKRPRNDSNLEEALAKVLKGKTMGVTEVAAAVQEAGYRTTSPNFRTIVNQALIRSTLIKKIARGQYTAA